MRKSVRVLVPGERRSTPIAAAAGTFFQKAGELQGRALRRGRIKTRDSHSKRSLWTMSRADSGNEKRTSKPNAWVSFLLSVDFSGEGLGARRGFGALPDGPWPTAPWAYAAGGPGFSTQRCALHIRPWSAAPHLASFFAKKLDQKNFTRSASPFSPADRPLAPQADPSSSRLSFRRGGPPPKAPPPR